MASTPTREQVKVGRLTVALTNTGKVLFPGDGITKGDLIGYYQAAAERMLPYLRDRPLAMARYPDGITGERIFQKNVGRHFPDWIPRVEVGKQGGQLCQVVATKAADLVYLANQACIELHPFLSRVERPAHPGQHGHLGEASPPGQLHRPDMLIFDLDPPGAGHFEAVRTAALRLREILEGDLGLAQCTPARGGFPRPNGLRSCSSADSSSCSRLRVCWSNPVPTLPVSWDEVADPALRADSFTLPAMPDRLAQLDKTDDPWAGMSRHRQGLTRPRRLLARRHP